MEVECDVGSGQQPDPRQASGEGGGVGTAQQQVTRTSPW
jgi:hypothetical protein